MSPADAAELRRIIGEPIEPVRFDVGDLDLTIDPLLDLDAFVNARWRAANPVPPDRSAWDCFSVLHERSLQIQAVIAVDVASGEPSGAAARIVGDLWISGMSAAASSSIDALRHELHVIESLGSTTALIDYLGERHARGWPVLFGFDVVADFDDPSMHVACVTQAGLGIPDPDIYREVGTQALLDAYALHIAALLAWSGVDENEVRTLAGHVVAFEQRLAAVSITPPVFARDMALRQHHVALDEADAITPGFSWRSFFERQGVEPPSTFSLAMPAFHREWSAMLVDTPLGVWRAYVACQTLAGVAPHVGGELGIVHHRFHGETLRGQSSPVPRWKQVIASINAFAGEAMGELYVERTFASGAAEKARALVERVRAALRARLIRLDWMSDATRNHALRKLAAMRAKIAHPPRWREWSSVRTSPDDWLGNLLAIRAYEHAWTLSKLDHPVDVDEWHMTPQTVNAGYDPQTNQVVFPAAILQPPFFDEKADDAFNYGGIGAVMAHEMTHGYDDQGSRFGIDGRFENWWSEEDRERFNRRADLLVALIEREAVSTADPVDGRLTLGENIADFGGLAVAFDAFCGTIDAGTAVDPPIGGYTRLQRFFLSWAAIWRRNLTPDEARRRLRIDPHAPAALRANAAPANMPEFARVFGAEASLVEKIGASCVRIW
jgi:putative endopeptidase